MPCVTEKIQNSIYCIGCGSLNNAEQWTWSNLIFRLSCVRDNSNPVAPQISPLRKYGIVLNRRRVPLLTPQSKIYYFFPENCCNFSHAKFMYCCVLKPPHFRINISNLYWKVVLLDEQFDGMYTYIHTYSYYILYIYMV